MFLLFTALEFDNFTLYVLVLSYRITEADLLLTLERKDASSLAFLKLVTISNLLRSTLCTAFELKFDLKSSSLAVLNPALEVLSLSFQYFEPISYDRSLKLCLDFSLVIRVYSL